MSIAAQNPGEDVRTQKEVMACQDVSSIVKTSLGPVGLDKMLVDDFGHATITTDGVTILRMLGIPFPPAKYNLIMSIAAQNPEDNSGEYVRTQNVMACQDVSSIVKTSLGPVGLDKMLVDDFGHATITTDGVTILRMLGIPFPPAKYNLIMSIAAQNPEDNSGEDVRTQNVMACQDVSSIVKTSLGPVGLDKMLVDDFGHATITTDGVTILRMLGIPFPPAKYNLIMSIAAQNPEDNSGEDVRTQNVMACQDVSRIVKTSLGPVGLDKMLVDYIDDVTFTNDGATILRMLGIPFPPAKNKQQRRRRRAYKKRKLKSRRRFT